MQRFFKTSYMKEIVLLCYSKALPPNHCTAINMNTSARVNNILKLAATLARQLQHTDSATNIRTHLLCFGFQKIWFIVSIKLICDFYFCELEPVRAAWMGVDECRKIIKMVVNAPETLCSIVLAATFQPVDGRFSPYISICWVLHQSREARTFWCHWWESSK